jgi:ketosteroid isomerase-like protein
MPRLNLKSILFLVALASFALLSLSKTSKADSPIAQTVMTPDEVTAEYSQLDNAVMKRDLDKIMSFFTDDFTELNADGQTVDREQERKDYQSRFNMIKSMTCRFDVQGISSAPGGNYCDLTIHMDGIGVKRVMFMRFQAAFTNELVVHDLWVNTPAGWRLKFRQTLKDHTVINTS